MKILKSLVLAAVMSIISAAAAQAAVEDYVWDGMVSEKIYSHDFENVTDKGWLNTQHLFEHEKINMIVTQKDTVGPGGILLIRNRNWKKDGNKQYMADTSSFSTHGEWVYPTEDGIESKKEETIVAYAKLPLLIGNEQKKRSHQILNVDVYVDNGAGKIGCVGHRYADDGVSPEVTNNVIIHFGEDGMIYRSDNKTQSTGIEYEQKKWYTLTLVADTEEAKLYSYLTPRDGNGETITIDDGRYISDWTRGSYILAFKVLTSKDTEEYSFYIDNYEHYMMYYPLPTDEQTYPVDGETDVDLYSDMTISFNNELAEGNSPAVTITDSDGNEFTGFQTEVDGKDVKISLNKPLAFNTKYTLKLDGGLIDENGNTTDEDTDLSFTTIPEQLYSSVPVLSCKDTIPEDKKITAYADVLNPTEDDMTVKLVLAGYDAFNGLTVFTEKEEIVASPGKTITTDVLELTGEEVYVRAYVTGPDGLICENFASLKEHKPTGGKKGEFKNIEVKVEGNIVTVSGAVDSGDTKLLFIEAGREDLTFSTFSPFYTKENGDFSYTFIVPEADGKYNVKLSGRRVLNNAKEEFYYISETTKEKILTAANDKPVSEIKKVLEADKDKLNTDSKYFTDNAYEVIYDQKPYESFGDVIEMMKKAYALLEEINSTNWAELGSVITPNSDIILFENEDYEYYTELSETNQNKIHSIIADTASEFDTLKSFSEAFSDAVYDYKQSKKKPSSGSSGGGGGSSGGGSSIKQSSNKVSTSAPITPAPVVKPVETTKAFNDLDTVLWAEESINALMNKGIIAKADDGKYRPNDYITREEFAKLIVTASGVEISNTLSTMKDVPENAWFAPFVAAGVQNGIIFGTGDGIFGVGSNITRQDMAVLIGRVLKEKAEVTGESYQDDAEISDYAKEAVYILKAKGVMSGMSEDSFAPMGYVTRAQAAKALYEMIKVNEDSVKE